MMKFEKRQVGWVRDGTKVQYKESQELKREFNSLPYHTLSFEYKFTFDGDVVYFSYTMPYTFRNLTSFLHSTIS